MRMRGRLVSQYGLFVHYVSQIDDPGTWVGNKLVWSTVGRSNCASSQPSLKGPIGYKMQDVRQCGL